MRPGPHQRARPRCPASEPRQAGRPRAAPPPRRRRRLRSGAGLPIDHSPAAIGIAKHRVHSPAHQDRTNGHVERHLDLVRRPFRPWTRLEGAPQLREVGVVGALVGCARQLVDVEQRLSRPSALEPRVEGGATTGERGRLAGRGRRSRRANSSGSRRSATSCDTDSCAGNPTSMIAVADIAAYSASNRSTSRRQPAARSCRSATSPGRTSDRRAPALTVSAPFRRAARTSSAPASTSGRRSPRGSTGQIASRAADRRGLTVPSGGTNHSSTSARSRISTKKAEG